MQKIEFEKSKIFNKPKIQTKRHTEIIESLEKMLEKGVPDLTMSEFASKLKISLRTLYEIAPSKDKLILMTKYLFIVNQAVGPKFDRFMKDIEKIDGSKKMADYHENFISTYTEKLLNEAIEKKEIQQINTKVFAVLFSSIGREFLNEKNRKSISTTPDENANSITSIILNGIKLKN